MPARTNVLTGVIIEPTILERPKYQSKEVFGEMNTGSVLYFDVPVLHYTQDTSISQNASQWYPPYFYDPNTKLLRLTASVDLGDTTMSLDLSNGSIVTRDYPVNYGGNYISDVPDNFERGHFAGGILSNEELQGLILLPDINFYTVGNVVSFIAPITIYFVNSCANANKDRFTWRFGDDTTSNDINPSHIYDMPGIYSVTLEAYNNTDPAFWSSVTKNNFISILTPSIVSSFNRNTNVVHLSLTDPLAGNVVFTATSTITLGDPTIDPSYGVLTYDWTFGDGGTGGNETIINHNYTIPGNYTVTLITRNNKYNISNTKTQTACIAVIAPEIYANFSADITSGIHSLSVTFTNSSTTGPVNYDWDFGDGAVSIDTSPVHIYSEAGVYTVTLTVKSGIYSSTMTKTDYINIT
jgi:PKD repeat protein